VSFQVAGHQTEKYRVNTSVYEGPLDLLLELIEKAELDITTLAIAQVTDQYLAYLQHLEYHDPEEVSAFLVIASRLIQIKSSALLPRPTSTDHTAEEEDPAEALAQQLILYKRFKELAQWLGKREADGYRTYLRVGPVSVKVDARPDLSGLSLRDLLDAARQAFASEQNLPSLDRVVNLPRITIRQKINAILTALKNNQRMNFKSILTSTDRIEIVVTFLAMLELIKRRVIQAEQNGLFDEISIDVLGDLDVSTEIELDFNE
jgi:segregation and condensation protein A